MVFLTVVIGTLNICLGYALAVYLGYGPPGLTETRYAPTTTPRTVQHEAANDESIRSVVQELVSGSLEEMLDDETDEEIDDDLEVESYDLPGDEAEIDDAGEPAGSDATQYWDLDEKYVETSILKLNIAMMKSGARATEIDTRLRACQGQSDRQTIEGCLLKLKEDCESYLNELSESAEKFSARIGELGELRELGEEIDLANLEQSAQIETTLSNLKHMDFESDLEAANLRLREEISHLRLARHKQRDNQDAAFVAVARYENRLEKIEKRLFNDPLTKLPNRIGLEATLWEWWKQGYPKSRQMSAVLFDLDDLSGINERHGPLIGDRILYQLARFIGENVGKLDLVARCAGQRFLLVMLDVGPRKATKNAEMIRQLVEKITFFSGQEAIRVTLGGAITEISPEEKQEVVFERLEMTLKQAKQAGPNRSFFHDGREAVLVESPNLGAEESHVQI